MLRETLQRTGRIACDGPIKVIPSPDKNYRLRATFHVRDRQVGFVRERGNSVIPIQECSSLVPELNAFIPQANKLLASFDDVEEIHAVSGPEVAATFDGRSTGMPNPRIQFMAPRMVYVSCNPSTFAREAALFLKQGYNLERITMIDQFPNTYHIEMAASFSL